jgi:hypothetical protein
MIAPKDIFTHEHAFDIPYVFDISFNQVKIPILNE